MKTKNDDMALMPNHIDDCDLVGFLDGELDVESQSAIGIHLESCWDCRSRLSGVERSIENFLTLRQETLLPPELPPSTPAVDLFRRRLVAHRSLTPAQSLLRHKLPDLRFWFQRIAAALNVAGYSLRTQILFARGLTAIVVVSIIIAFVLFSGRFNTVSASELLRLSAAAEAEQLETVDQPVIHQKLEVKRNGSSAANWEVWNDTVNGRVRTGSQSDLGNANDVIADLRLILAANHMNAQQPLSAVSYRSWSDSLSNKSEVVEKGTDTLTLQTTPASALNGQISEAKFIVHTGDYHPSGLYLNVKTAAGDQAYELTEETFTVVSLKDVDHAIFADPTKVEMASTKSVSSTLADESLLPANESGPGEPAAVTNGSAPVAPASSADEVDILDRLHQIGADISEQLTVTRTADGRLLIEGLVETDRRKKEILQALTPFAKNPAIRIKVQTIEEAAKVLQQQTQHVAPGTVERVEVEKGALAVDSDLRAYFTKQGGDTDAAIRSYASRVMAHSQSAVFQASALNRMANRFTTAQLGELDPAARTKWLGILKGYASAVRRETAALRGDLQPVFGGFQEGGGKSVRSDADLIASARQLFALASANEQAVRAAFTLSSAGSASAVKTTQFRRSIAEAEALAAGIERAK